jgi:hypothetical protein
VRGFLRIVIIGFVFFGFLASAQSTSAACCGTFTCTKRDSQNKIVDNYTTTCGCQNDAEGCPAGYVQESNSCHTASTSCGSGGGGTCECGTKTDGTCKNCNQLQCSVPGYGIDCPAGTVRTNNITSSVCLAHSGYCGPGTAQTIGACCETYQPPRECGEWYHCPYNGIFIGMPALRGYFGGVAGDCAYQNADCNSTNFD